VAEFPPASPEQSRMKVYVFGNEDVPEDRKAIEAARRMDRAVDGVSFVFVGPNEDVPFADEDRVVILDTVHGIRDVELIKGDRIDALVLSPRGSVHDFDLAFQLRYLRKIGKLGAVTVIGVPQEGRLDHPRIQSILRKLVAHDMHGS
jgi:Ni,Fe-hydrogenase maturation factor